jgi:hypothetical protein
MELTRNPDEELSLGFTNPQPGTSIVQIQEGVAVQTSEENSRVAIMVPIKIVEVIEGDQENDGKGANLFVNLISKEGEKVKFGEETICRILSFTGLAEAFEKRFPGPTSFTDDEFTNALKAKLPGTLLKLTHDIDMYTDKNGRDRESFEAKKLAKATKVKPKTEPEPEAGAAGDDNDKW